MKWGVSFEHRFVIVCTHAAWPSDYTLNTLNNKLRTFYNRVKDELSAGLIDAYLFPIPTWKHLPTTDEYLDFLLEQSIEKLAQIPNVHAAVTHASNFHFKLPKKEQQSMGGHYKWVHGPLFLQKYYT